MRSVLPLQLVLCLGSVLIAAPVAGQGPNSNRFESSRPALDSSPTGFVKSRIGAQIDIQEEPRRKDPFVAGILSWILPGGGQFYNGQAGKGVLFLVGYGASIGAIIAGSGCSFEYDDDYYDLDCGDDKLLYGGVLGYLVVDIWSIVDAVSTAKSINRGASKKGKSVVLFEKGNTSIVAKPQIADGHRVSAVGLSISF